MVRSGAHDGARQGAGGGQRHGASSGMDRGGAFQSSSLAPPLRWRPPSVRLLSGPFCDEGSEGSSRASTRLSRTAGFLPSDAPPPARLAAQSFVSPAASASTSPRRNFAPFAAQSVDSATLVTPRLSHFLSHFLSPAVAPVRAGAFASKGRGGQRRHSATSRRRARTARVPTTTRGARASRDRAGVARARARDARRRFARSHRVVRFQP